MAKLALVKCRVCHGEIDREAGIEGVDWMSPSRNYFYHPTCYNDWARKKSELSKDIHTDAENDLWFAALYDYMRKDLKIGLDMKKTTSQWHNFLKKGFTAKGIYFTIRYFFDIQHGNVDKTDGIGIVSVLYQEGCQYWIDREQHDHGICARIEAQMRESIGREKKIVLQARATKTPKKIDLSSIADMEDEV